MFVDFNNQNDDQALGCDDEQHEIIMPKLSVFQEGFDGQMTEDNIEVGIASSDGFRKLDSAEVKDYLAAIQ